MKRIRTLSILLLLFILGGGIENRADEIIPEEPEFLTWERGPKIEAEEYGPEICTVAAPRHRAVKTPPPALMDAPELPELTREPEVDPVRLEMIACEIYSEAGGDDCSDSTRYRCGDVPLMRELDPRFPDTLEEVLTEEGQFGRWHWTGIVWPERASRADEAAAVQRAYDIAKDILLGNHSDLWGLGYVWMAEFPQGTDVIYADGVYFGR